MAQNKKATAKKTVAKKTVAKKTTVRRTPRPTGASAPQPTPKPRRPKPPQVGGKGTPDKAKTAADVAKETTPEAPPEETEEKPSEAPSKPEAKDDKKQPEKKPEKKPRATPASKATPGSTVGGLRIEKVGEQSNFFKGLIYGNFGAGKTYLAGLASLVPEMAPVLFIDIEGGVKTLKDPFPDIDVVRVRDEYDKNGNLKVSAWKTLEKIYKDARTGKLPYKTYIFDSLTESHALSMSLALSYAAEKAEAKGRDKDPEVPEQADWGRAGVMLRKMVRAFRDLDAHIIFTALEAEIKDDKTGAITVQPSLPGKLAKEVPGYMDEVFYLYTKVQKREGDQKPRAVRMIQTQPSGKYVAKDRSGRLPLVMREPTMAKLAYLILGEKREDETEEEQEVA